MTLLDNRFELLHQLGAGGMAEVYLARDRKLERDVAIKLLNAASSRDPGLGERFRKECKALAKLTHRNIVTLHDVGETDDGQFYLVMEHLQGEALSELLARSRQQEEILSWQRLAGIIRQVCMALEAAHTRQIVHRDIKPSNIFRLDEVSPGEDLIKVLDFGIAKFTTGHESETDPEHLQLTATGNFVGTPHYIAPETIAPDMFGPVDGRADIYGLGVILYQGISGTLPFEGQPRAAIHYKTVNEDPPPLSERAPHVSPEIEALVMRAIARRPEDRFATVREFADALDSVSDAGTAVIRASYPPASGPGVASPAVDDAEQEAPATAAPQRPERSLTELTTIGGSRKNPPGGPPVQSPREGAVVGVSGPTLEPPALPPDSEPRRQPRSTASVIAHGLGLWFIVVIAWRLISGPTQDPAPPETVLSENPTLTATSEPTKTDFGPPAFSTSTEAEADADSGAPETTSAAATTGPGSVPPPPPDPRRTRRQLATLLAGSQKTVDNCTKDLRVLDGVEYALAVSVAVAPPQRELRITETRASKSTYRPFPPAMKDCILAKLRTLRVGPVPAPVSQSREFVVR
jgi:serine/threonine protein kinase